MEKGYPTSDYLLPARYSLYSSLCARLSSDDSTSSDELQKSSNFADAHLLTRAQENECYQNIRSRVWIRAPLGNHELLYSFSSLLEPATRNLELLLPFSLTAFSLITFFRLITHFPFAPKYLLILSVFTGVIA